MKACTLTDGERRADKPADWYPHWKENNSDFFIGPGCVWGLLPRPCWWPPLISISIRFMDCGGLDRGPCLLRTIHTFCHNHWMCCNSVIIPSVHMTYFASVHPGEGSSSVTLLKVYYLFSLWEGYFYFLGVFSDPKWGQSSGMSSVLKQIRNL